GRLPRSSCASCFGTGRLLRLSSGKNLTMDFMANTEGGGADLRRGIIRTPASAYGVMDRTTMRRCRPRIGARACAAHFNTALFLAASTACRVQCRGTEIALSAQPCSTGSGKGIGRVYRLITVILILGDFRPGAAPLFGARAGH